jgi:phosphoadenosine phosphosulfate reductase
MTVATPALSPDEVTALAERFAGSSPEEIVAWAVDTYGSKLAISCSFGGTSGMVILDMALRRDRSVSVVYVDTDYLFPETHDTVRTVEERYRIKALAFRSELSREAQERLHGAALWETDPDRCCEIRKVTPMRTALANFDAYLTGIRRDQSSTRGDAPVVQWDAKFGLLKINPLVSWTERDVWSYIMAHELPYNPLHDRGYPSIGCTNCTRAVNPGDDPRSGRWSGSGKVECGLHIA